MVDAGRSMSWGTWLQERDSAPLEVFSTWLRDQVPAGGERRAPTLNPRPDRFEDLSRELFDAYCRSADVCTVQQADLVECVVAISTLKNGDAAAAKAKCESKLRREFGRPELLLPFDLFRFYLAHFMDQAAESEQGQEIILQSLLVQAHLGREAREAEQAASLSRQRSLLEAAEADELAIAPADDRGPGDGPIAIATPVRCRPRRKKGSSVFNAVCG